MTAAGYCRSTGTMSRRTTRPPSRNPARRRGRPRRLALPRLLHALRRGHAPGRERGLRLPSTPGTRPGLRVRPPARLRLPRLEHDLERAASGTAPRRSTVTTSRWCAGVLLPLRHRRGAQPQARPLVPAGRGRERRGLANGYLLPQRRGRGPGLRQGLRLPHARGREGPRGEPHGLAVPAPGPGGRSRARARPGDAHGPAREEPQAALIWGEALLRGGRREGLRPRPGGSRWRSPDARGPTFLGVCAWNGEGARPTPRTPSCATAAADLGDSTPSTTSASPTAVARAWSATQACGPALRAGRHAGSDRPRRRAAPHRRGRRAREPVLRRELPEAAVDDEDPEALAFAAECFRDGVGVRPDLKRSMPFELAQAQGDTRVERGSCGGCAASLRACTRIRTPPAGASDATQSSRASTSRASASAASSRWSPRGRWTGSTTSAALHGSHRAPPRACAARTRASRRPPRSPRRAARPGRAGARAPGRSRSCP